MGAGMAVSEMVASNSLLWGSEKTRRRADHEGEVSPISVQIAGADPVMMAAAAQYNVDQGAQIIDINMGCPARKICNVMAGSALLQDEPLVRRIVEAVVRAVRVPVTLKIRTGWDRSHRNAVRVAKLAADSGIQALAVHGRTRACGYSGEAEYDTISEVKAAVDIPVIAKATSPRPKQVGTMLACTAPTRHDRARRPGPAVDFPRIGITSRPARLPPPEVENPSRAGGACAGYARSTASRPGCASRASTFRVLLKDSPGRRLPMRDEPVADLRRQLAASMNFRELANMAGD